MLENIRKEWFNPKDPFNLGFKDIISAYHDFLLQVGPYVPPKAFGHRRFFKTFRYTPGTPRLVTRRWKI